MSETSRGGMPADNPIGRSDDVDSAWENFEDGLASYLLTMVAPDEGDHLLIELAVGELDGGCAPYAQFAAFDGGRSIRAEISGDAYLAPAHRLAPDGVEFFRMMDWSGNDGTEKNWFLELPVDHADSIANHVAWALRYHFAIAHPHLLAFDAWGPAADGAAVLGLIATRDVPQDAPQPLASPYPPIVGSGHGSAAEIRGHESVLDRLALKPVDRDDLLHIVESLLREKYDAEPTIDEDGDFVLNHRGQPVWVRVRDDQPAIEIMARVAHDVRSRRATAVELTLLNRDNLWVRWTLRVRNVWQTLALPAAPVVPSHLSAMLDLFMDVMTETRDDLAFRTGAKVG